MLLYVSIYITGKISWQTKAIKFMLLRLSIQSNGPILQDVTEMESVKRTRCEVLTVLLVKIQVWWKITLFLLVNRY